MNNGLNQDAIANAAQTWKPKDLQTWQADHGINAIPSFISVARIVPKMQFDLMIKALSHLKQKGYQCKWVVIGDGEQLPELQALAQSLHVADLIIWAGALYSEDAVAPWALSATALVHPGTIGLATQKALGYGLPVITHDCMRHHNPEACILKNNYNALLFEEQDATGLTNALETLMADTLLLARLRENAKAAGERYNTRVMADRFSEIVHLAKNCGPT